MKPRDRDARRPRPPQTSETGSGALHIWGLHAVGAALANAHRSIVSLRLTDNAEHRLTGRIAARKLKVTRASPRDLERILGPEAVHQGALAEVEPLPEPSLAELIAAATAKAEPLVVLDQVTDPHNVGAILRSAAVLGAAGLIMTARHSPPLAGALAKAASGALELVPVALVGNLARALAELSDAGVRCIGLDGEAQVAIEEEQFEPPVALVLGSEGKGLRRLTRELCDGLVRIGGRGPLASLNVSNAAAVALYAAKQRRSRAIASEAKV